MSVLFIALPIALLLGGLGMVACVLCIRHGQYDDLESPPVRILIDDDISARDAGRSGGGTIDSNDATPTESSRKQSC